MQRAPLLRADHYRDMTTQLRALADAETLSSLRRHLRRLAAQHEEMAGELKRAECVGRGTDND